MSLALLAGTSSNRMTVLPSTIDGYYWAAGCTIGYSNRPEEVIMSDQLARAVAQAQRMTDRLVIVEEDEGGTWLTIPGLVSVNVTTKQSQYNGELAHDIRDLLVIASLKGD